MSEDGIRRTELDGGLSVLSQPVQGVRSASVGIWVRYGSAHEGPGELGVAHLLEHMVFKGTGGRSARDIAVVLERLGGSLDAYTSREHTSYQARVLDADLDTALEVVTDLVADPLLRDEDLELEREVVLEEISTVEDTPDDMVFELHTEALWPDHCYGHSILGTRATVGSLGSEDLRRAHRAGYRRPGLVVAATGNIDHDRIVQSVGRLLGGVPNGGAPPSVPEPPPAPMGERVVERPGAQTHIVLGGRTVPHADPRRFPLVLLSSALGGGMSSRLFQRVREDLGLAYAIYTFQSFYRTAGSLGVYVGTRPEWADRAVAVIREELGRVAAEGLPAEELEDAKGQVKGQMVLGLESPGGRLYRLALQELYGEPYRGVDELTARIDAVTMDEIGEVAGEFLDPERWLTVRLGPAR
ncbi:MAG TPA: pitrilysin family protein [Longimicrobiales bacterium]|nr:pitrilysin family protein [Longimicrobiales bacterium]